MLLLRLLVLLLLAACCFFLFPVLSRAEHLRLALHAPFLPRYDCIFIYCYCSTINAVVLSVEVFRDEDVPIFCCPPSAPLHVSTFCLPEV